VSRRARKRFGQHFLEPQWVEKLVAAIDPQPDETFVEIGPGRAALTRPLASRARRVIAFEIDRDLARALRAEALPNVDVVEGDFLETAPAAFRRRSVRSPAPESPIAPVTEPFRVAGNLPYNVAAPILFTLIELYRGGAALRDATVMLQREVADRLLAPPGSKEYGVLGVLVARAAHVERLLDLPPGAFRPAPKVRSSVVRLRFRPAEPPARDEAVLAAVVQAVFTRRRKTIANALQAYRPGAQVPGWLDPVRRPETLTGAEFVRLADSLAG
jgi:16S rRNA (adenine1518-N6/adenine1519-N6)-dimethyltransferase